MNEEKLQIILDYLDKIAAKLNIGIHEVWPWFIKQQFVDAYVSLGFLLATIVIAGIVLLVTVKLWRKDNKYSKDIYYYEKGERVERRVERDDQVCAYSIYHQNHEVGWIWANVVCIAIVLFTAFIFYMQFFDIFNPEYSAFKDLAGMMPTIQTK